MRTLAFGVLLGACVSSAAAGAAGSCPSGGRAWIELEFETSQPTGATDAAAMHLQQRVTEHLRVEFDRQQIDVCTSRSAIAPAPLATLRIARDSSNEAIVRAWANDAVTQKELSRHLSLDGLPEDAHAMAIALGASELLRASWIELRLDSRPKSVTAVPPSVERTIRESEWARHRFGDVAIIATSEAFSGGVKQFGMDAQLAVALIPEIDALVRVGGRSSLSAKSKHGSASADGWLVGIGAQFAVLRPVSGVRITLQTRLDAMWVDFSALANKGANATAASGNTCWASIGLGTDLRVAERASLEAGVMAGRLLRIGQQGCKCDRGIGQYLLDVDRIGNRFSRSGASISRRRSHGGSRDPALSCVGRRRERLWIHSRIGGGTCGDQDPVLTFGLSGTRSVVERCAMHGRFGSF